MSAYSIGQTAKMLQAKLADHLAGPLQTFLPQHWVTEALQQIGHRFRSVAFSPLGAGVGVHRAGAGPGSIV